MKNILLIVGSLRFVPYDEMEVQGYGYLLDLFE